MQRLVAGVLCSGGKRGNQLAPGNRCVIPWTVMTNTALGVTKPQATNISDRLTCDIMLSSTKPTLENYLSCKNVSMFKTLRMCVCLLFIVCVCGWMEGAPGVLLYHCLPYCFETVSLS